MGKIMYVENDPNAFEWYQRLHSRVAGGREGLFYSDGTSALEALNKGIPDLDLVVTDLDLYGKINGMKLLEKIRANENYKNTRAILASGNKEELEEKGLENRARDMNAEVLKKPFSLQNFENTVKRLLKE